MDGVMALPIGQTPVLKGKEAKRFCEKLKREESQKVGLVPTPNLKDDLDRLLSVLTHGGWPCARWAGNDNSDRSKSGKACEP
jgi:hypothetical protein